jgi:uncharacterized protein with HEPN domain
MSLRDPQKYLYDMLSSCEFLLEFTQGKSVDDYAEDRPFVRRLNANCRS